MSSGCMTSAAMVSLEHVRNLSHYRPQHNFKAYVHIHSAPISHDPVSSVLLRFFLVCFSSPLKRQLSLRPTKAIQRYTSVIYCMMI